MSRPPRESLDYDTWLQQRAGVWDDAATSCRCGHRAADHRNQVEYSDGYETECDTCDCGAYRAAPDHGDDRDEPDDFD